MAIWDRQEWQEQQEPDLRGDGGGPVGPKRSRQVLLRTGERCRPAVSPRRGQAAHYPPEFTGSNSCPDRTGSGRGGWGHGGAYLCGERPTGLPLPSDGPVPIRRFRLPEYRYPAGPATGLRGSLATMKNTGPTANLYSNGGPQEGPPSGCWPPCCCSSARRSCSLACC